MGLGFDGSVVQLVVVKSVFLKRLACMHYQDKRHNVFSDFYFKNLTHE
jgi:hypothetical protein